MSALLDTTAENCLWLRDEKGLPVSAIALRLGITPKAVNNALRRMERKADPKRPMKRAANGHRAPELDPGSIVYRDPCPKCGVRADLHAQAGCKRWRPVL